MADDPTGTVVPPELLREVCEAAVGAGLLIVSDETWRDTLHEPHSTVLLSPAEMWPEDAVVLTDLAGARLPPGRPAAVARFPADARAGAARAGARDTRRPPRRAPVARGRRGGRRPGRAGAGTGPYRAGRPRVRDRRGACPPGADRRRVLCRPPRAGRHLYADLDELRGCWPPAASPTRWSWSATSGRGWPGRCPAATASATRRPRCASGCRRCRCSAGPGRAAAGHGRRRSAGTAVRGAGAGRLRRGLRHPADGWPGPRPADLRRRPADPVAPAPPGGRAAPRTERSLR
ncbi:hypothetical protein NKH77_41575 [Streptomyces sp. M19]